MRKVIDISLQRFGKLVTTGEYEPRDGVLYWECLCDCGSVVFKRGDHLKSGNTTSCGKCNHENLSGIRFGSLVAIDRDFTRTKRTYYNCKCDCGNSSSVSSDKLKAGSTKTCGKCERPPAVNRKTLDYFLERSKIHHGDKYDYSLVEYTGMRNPVRIICPIHGEFLQNAFEHINGKGCKLCAKMPKLTKEEWDIRAAAIDAEWLEIPKKSSMKGTLKCMSCGHEWQSRGRSVQQGQRCPVCTDGGFDKEKVGCVYIIKNKTLVKVGITNNYHNVDKRIKSINKTIDDQFFFVEKYIMHGAHCQKIEGLCHKNMLMSGYVNPDYVFSGFTESFVNVPEDVAKKIVVDTIFDYFKKIQ